MSWPDSSGSPASPDRVHRRLRPAFGATIAAGASVALAPAIPAGIRMHTLVAVLIAWGGVMAWTAARLAPPLLRRPPDAVGWITTAAGVLGAGFALLGVSEYWLVRLVTGRAALSWSIDWRGHWNHAQAVARTGGIQDALDYAGEPIAYHVGPAWTAGAVEAVFGTGLHTTLFAVVPVLSVAAIFLALADLLRRQIGLPWRAAGAAVGITLALPALNAWIVQPPNRLLGGGLQTLLDPQIWWAPTVMLNAVIGLAAGLAGLALLLDREAGRGWRLAGAIGLAAVVSLKPQYFMGLGAVAGVMALGRLAGRGVFRPRSPVLLGWSLGALALAVALLSGLPGFDPIFQGPVLRPGDTVYPGWAFLRELGGLHVWLLVLGLAAYWLAREAAPGAEVGAPSGGSESLPGQPGIRYGALALPLGVTAAFVLVALGLFTFEFPFRPEIIERGLALGIPDAEAVQQNNLIQSLIPLRILMTLAGVALVVRWVVARREARWAAGVAFIGLLATFAPTPYMLYAARNPNKAFDAAADPGLYTVLEGIPRGDELIIASDQADPADDFYRPLNGELLPAYHGHRFYTANLRFQHWIKASAAERLQNQRLFFGTPWSAWHGAWLARTGVTHVLVHDRCPPAWSDPPSLIEVEEAGGWTAYRVDPGNGATAGGTPPAGDEASGDAAGDPVPAAGARPAPPGAVSIEPAYGRAACLEMLSIPGGRAWGERGAR